jgi:hypothetical protein
MPSKLPTTVSKVVHVSNKTNSPLIEEFHKYIKAKDSSERHQNNVPKTIMTYANFLGSDSTFLIFIPSVG